MSKNVIIIGAGAAGISAGIYLCTNGFKVKILERRNIPGGRAYSTRDGLTGEMLDNGQHLLAGAYKYFPAMLKALGTDIYLNPQKALNVPFIDKGRISRLNAGLLPGKAGLVLGLLLFGALTFKSKVNIIKFFLRLNNGKIGTPNSTTLDLLRKENQTDESIARFWNPIIVSALNLNADKADSRLFIAVMEKAFFSGPENSRLIFPSVDFNELFEPAGNWFLERGSELLFSRQAKQLNVIGDKIKSIKINKDEIDDFDFVISAVPPNYLMKIIPDEYNNHPFFSVLPRFEFSPIISAFFWFDTDIFRDKFAALLNSKLHWVFNRRRICRFNKSIGGNFPYCLSFTISDAGELADMSMEKLRDLLLDEIRLVFPEAASANLLHSKIIIEKNATPQLTPEMEPLRPPAATPLKNLFIAGDWTATGLPATLESAARSGYMAAEAVIGFDKLNR